MLFTLVGTGLSPATAAETAAPAQAPKKVVRTGLWIGTQNKKVRDRLKKRLPGYRHWFPTGAGSKANPISWKKDRFVLVTNSNGKKMRGSVRAHKGHTKQTPARWVNWVLLRDKRTNQRFVVVNTHLINGVWNGNHPENRSLWFTHREVLRNRINAVQKFQAPIFVVGDFNKKQGPVQLPGVRRIPMKNGSTPYDHIYAEPGTHATKVVTKKVLMGKLHGADHHALRTHVVIRRF